MKRLFKKHEHHWPTHKIVISALWGVVFLVVSLFINYLAGTYATLHAGNSVSDIILDRLPTYDVDGIFIYGIAAFFVFVAILVAYRPKRLPFILKSLSLFIAMRSFFIILTHIGPAPTQIPLDMYARIMNTFTFTGDLFFSAHTGFPFLMALIFWEKSHLRNLFLCLSVFFGIVVLLGHLHYSIDVFSAFFITYGIFHIAARLFKKDFDLLRMA